MHMVRPALGLAAVLLCIGIAASLLFARQENAIIASVATQAHRISSSTPPDAVVMQLQRPGARVDVLQRPLPPPNGGPPLPPPPARGRFGLLLHLLGVGPQRIPNGDRVIIVHPDESVVGPFFWLTALALVLIYAVSLLLLLSAARTAEQAAMQPLLQTTAALEALAEGDFTPHRIAAGRRAEIAALAQAYTRASHRVAHAIHEEAQARAQMRQFIGDAGHELRTPMTIVNTYLDLLAKPAVDEETFAKIVTGMRTEMKRMRRLVENLLSLMRMEQDSQQRDVVDAAALAGAVVERLSRIAGECQIVLAAPQSAPVAADARDLDDALSNLIENALKYGGGTDVRVGVTSSGERVHIDVDDAGPGIAPPDRSRLFDRFFRGANAGGTDGSGLGLAIAKLAVQRSGGSVRYQPLEPGSRFRIELPMAGAS